MLRVYKEETVPNTNNIRNELQKKGIGKTHKNLPKKADLTPTDLE